MFLGCSEAPEEERASGSHAGWGAQRAQKRRGVGGAEGSGPQNPRVPAGRPLHQAEKVPHLRSGGKPSLQQAPSPALCGDPLARSGGRGAVTPLGLT